MASSEFADMLLKEKELQRSGRRKQQSDVPRFLRAGDQTWLEGEREYAVLLCRATGLRRAAGQHLDALGGAAYAQRAIEKLDRLLNLTGKQLNNEKAKIARRYTAHKPNALGVIGPLFEVWIFTEAAREINKRFVALHGKRLSEQLDAIKTWQALSNSSFWGEGRGASDSHFRDPQA